MTGREFTVTDIHLALDGELSGDDRADFERWLETHPEMKALSARFERDRAIVAGALAPILDEPVPSRLAKLASGEARPRRSRMILLRNAAAAAVIFVAGGVAGYLGGSLSSEESVD